MATAKAKTKTKTRAATPKKNTAKKNAAKKIPAKKKRAALADAAPRASRLTRALNPMPSWVKRALVSRGLMAAYEDRPDFQKNDYLWWISSAKRESTRDKRLAQMLDELEKGGLYMNMIWRPLRRR